MQLRLSCLNITHCFHIGIPKNGRIRASPQQQNIYIYNSLRRYIYTHPKTKMNAPCLVYFPCMALTQLHSTWAMEVNVPCIDHMKQGYGYKKWKCESCNPTCQTMCFPRSSESSWHQECENLENIMINKTSYTRKQFQHVATIIKTLGTIFG